MILLRNTTPSGVWLLSLLVAALTACVALALAACMPVDEWVLSSDYGNLAVALLADGVAVWVPVTLPVGFWMDDIRSTQTPLMQLSWKSVAAGWAAVVLTLAAVTLRRSGQPLAYGFSRFTVTAGVALRAGFLMGAVLTLIMIPQWTCIGGHADGMIEIYAAGCSLQVNITQFFFDNAPTPTSPIVNSTLTTRSTPTIPMWLPTLAIAVIGGIWSRPRRQHALRCRCGYCLVGNVSGRCPECGRHLPARSMMRLRQAHSGAPHGMHADVQRGIEG
ncbi:MAG: hypothetical protein PVJ57_23110 [Phycisphaerae bacterium]